MNDSPPIDILASAAGQQPFEFLMQGLFVYAVVVFAVLGVLAVFLIAACGWETIRTNRENGGTNGCGR